MKMVGKKKTKPKQKKENSAPAEKPISLAPLSFEDALKGLAQTKPSKSR